MTPNDILLCSLIRDYAHRLSHKGFIQPTTGADAQTHSHTLGSAQRILQKIGSEDYRSQRASEYHKKMAHRIK